MTFIESLKIVWMVQFAISGLIIIRECQTDPETLEELQGFTPLITVFFFLLCCFGGWYVIYSTAKDYLYIPLWLRRPDVWFYYKYGWDLKQKRRDLKAWYLRKARKLAA